MMGIKRTKIDVSPEVIRQVALRRFTGDTWEVLEKDLGLTKAVLRRVASSEMAKEIQKGALKTEQDAAQIYFKKRLTDMIDKAVAAIERGLDEGKLEAVKIYCQAAGFLNEEKGSIKQQQAIQVILPAGIKTKNVKVISDQDLPEEFK